MEPGEGLVGPAIGVIFGLALQLIYGSDSRAERLHPVVQYRRQRLCPAAANDRYAAGLRVNPSAVARLHNASQLGKISFLSIGTLLFTTLIAAPVGVLVTNMFGLTAEGLVQAARRPPV